VLEALACGCPVVGYPSVSVHEPVLPGGGEIVEQDRIDQLAAALPGWVNDPDRRDACSAGARRRVEDSFDIRKITDQLWTEYGHVVLHPALDGRRSRVLDAGVFPGS
jgi:glycosyltransferase involved in cell wall biosynthesis